MKKIISVLVVLAMVLTAVPLVIANNVLAGPDPVPESDPDAYDDPYTGLPNIPTYVTVAGGGSQADAPVVKCKWEYDLDVVLETPPPGQQYCLHHDACPFVDHLQVKPILAGDVTVGFYAVVTDPQGKDDVQHIYADVWHPDGEFKYQIELLRVGFVGEVYFKTTALDAWAHVSSEHSDLVMINSDWEATLPGGITPEDDIYDELNEELAYLYYGEAVINYCQPGGWYYVGVRGHDTANNWCPYLFNRFWDIPTSGIEVDFSSVDYQSAAVGVDKWVGGDVFMNTPLKPTVRNIGNTPVGLYVWQDATQFGQTGGLWDVYYDARLNASGTVVTYDPFETDTGKLGVRIPGTLPLCTQDKLDFSIHVKKSMQGLHTGIMNLFAYIDTNYWWYTPPQFIETAPLFVPQVYDGPADPWL